MKKRILCLFLCIVLCLTMLPSLPPAAEAADGNVISVDTFEELRDALEANCVSDVRLTGDINLGLAGDYDSRVHLGYTPDGDNLRVNHMILVSGTHRLDLNGHEIWCYTYYNKNFSGENYRENNRIHADDLVFFELLDHSSLTVDDSAGGGKVELLLEVPEAGEFKAKKVTFTRHTWLGDDGETHYSGMGWRTIFEGSGDAKLVINGGDYTVGNAQKYKKFWLSGKIWFVLGGTIASMPGHSTLTVNGGSFFSRGHQCSNEYSMFEGNAILNDGYFECKQSHLGGSRLNGGEVRYTHYDEVFWMVREYNGHNEIYEREGYRGNVYNDVRECLKPEDLITKKITYNGRVYTDWSELLRDTVGSEETSDRTLKIEPKDSADRRIAFSGTYSKNTGVTYGYVRGEDLKISLVKDGLNAYGDDRFGENSEGVLPLRQTSTLVELRGVSQQTEETARAAQYYDGAVTTVNLKALENGAVWGEGDLKGQPVTFLTDWKYSVQLYYVFEWDGYNNWTYFASAETPLHFVVSEQAYPINCLNGMDCAVKEAVPGVSVEVFYAGDRFGTLNEVILEPDIPFTRNHDGLLGDFYTFVMPDSPVTVSADVTPYTYELSVSGAVEHGTVTLSDTTAEARQTVTVTVTPDPDYELVRIDTQSAANVLENTGSGKYSLTVFSDDVIYAEFARRTCTVSFANDAGTVVDTVTANSGAISLNVTGDAYYRAGGWLHDGWTSYSGGSLLYALSDTYTGSSDVKLYPHYSEISAASGVYEITNFTVPKCGDTPGIVTYYLKAYIDEPHEDTFWFTTTVYKVNPATGAVTEMGGSEHFDPSFRYRFVFELELYNGCKTPEYGFGAGIGRVNGSQEYVQSANLTYNSERGIYDIMTITTRDLVPRVNELAQARVMIEPIKTIGGSVAPMLESGAYNYPYNTEVVILSNTYTVNGETITAFACTEPTVQTILLEPGVGCAFTPDTVPVTPLDYSPGGYRISGRYLSADRYEVTVVHPAWALTEHNVTVNGGYTYYPRAKAGTEVTVFTDADDFLMWQVSGTELSVEQMKSAHMDFTMPDNDVTLTVIAGGANSHMRGELLSSTPATCTASGRDVYACVYAGHTDNITVKTPALGHSLTALSQTAATCVTTGLSCDCWYCARCGKYFSDETGKTQISSPVTPVDPDAHPAAGYHHNDGGHWTECEFCGWQSGHEAHDWCLDAFDPETGERIEGVLACVCGSEMDSFFTLTAELLNASDAAVSGIPTGTLRVALHVGGSVPEDVSAAVIVGVYGTGGRMLGAQFAVLTGDDTGTTVFFPVDNTDGSVADIEILTLSPEWGYLPCIETIDFTKA